MVLRQILRVPMGVFDEYRALCFKSPRMMNFFMMYAGMVALLYLGRGMEKLCMSGEATRYEQARRARRLYLPYFVASYKFRFPENK
jgi:hypothetical protein